MAQLVERTLGKGEVPSSILGISTIFFKKIASEVQKLFLFCPSLSSSFVFLFCGFNGRIAL